MAEAILLDVAKSLGLSLASYAKNELLQAWGLATQVQKLQRTMKTINAVLKDAEEKPGSSTIGHADQDWLTNLRDAVYDAADVFDEIVTRAERKKIMEGIAFVKEVKLFFSSSNQLLTSIILSRRVKSIREDLDDISKDRRDFGNTMRSVVVVIEDDSGTRPLTRGLSDGDDDFDDFPDKVVGRENDKNALMSMLLDSSANEVVSVIPIVGVGGLGKSTLARVVYDDEQVKARFDLHLWVTLTQRIRLDSVMEKLIVALGGSATNCDLEELKLSISRHIDGKKYVIVLDNVWNEDTADWGYLMSALSLGANPGSKILLTTRSLSIAKNMGTVPPHELQGLSPGDSWILFERMVFGKRGCHEPRLRELGNEILRIGKNIPLSIKAIAGVLATKVSVRFWSMFKNDAMSNLAAYGRGYNIMPILKTSYDHLQPTSLKACFCYCSLFPRGYVFDKNKLVSLWIAQGLVEPLHNDQSLEDEGAGYLDILLNRILLEDIPGDESRNTCKLHDLMYDLSCLVAGKQCKMLSSTEMENNDFERSVHHICISYQVDSSWRVPVSMQSVKQLRTFLLAKKPSFEAAMGKPLCDNLITSFCSLRVLDLHGFGIKKLPRSIGKLIHLRYLDLSDNLYLKNLPNSITSLHNLLYLDLSRCRELIGIPKGIKKLVNMRHLQLDANDGLHFFPSGFGNLTNLHSLNVFVVPEVQSQCFSCKYNKSDYGRLSDLRCLNNLRGELTISIRGSYQSMAQDAGKANMRGKKNLRCLKIIWTRSHHEEDEKLLENLQPHHEISELEIRRYEGIKLPKWMEANQLASCLPCLTSIIIDNIPNVKHLPSFSRMPLLKHLVLVNLLGLEYLESSIDASSPSSSSSTETVFFPTLTMIQIGFSNSLKGWRGSGVGDLSFPCAAEVWIHHCNELRSMPSCPSVKKLTLLEADNLQMLRAHNISSSTSFTPKLEYLQVDSVEYLASLLRECLPKVSNLTFFYGIKPMELIKLGKTLEGMISLQTLKFHYCPGLTSLSGMPNQLSNLQRLEFIYCDKLEFSGDGADNAWNALKSLRFLKFDNVFNLEALPPGIRYITTLQTLELRLCPMLQELPDWIGDLCSLSRLEINYCCEITSLPEGMRKLTKLQLLLIETCPALQERCRTAADEDWDKIQHIPNVIVRWGS